MRMEVINWCQIQEYNWGMQSTVPVNVPFDRIVLDCK